MRKWRRKLREENELEIKYGVDKIRGSRLRRRKGGMQSHICLIAVGVRNAWQGGGMDNHIFHGKYYQKTLFLS
jgi:hypothetical protein